MKKLYCIPLLILFIFTCLFCNKVIAQEGRTSIDQIQPAWTVNPFDHKLFIENDGQFNNAVKDSSQVLYGVQVGKVWAYFTSHGVIFRYDEYPEDKLDPDEKSEAKPLVHILSAEWENTNPSVTVEAQKRQSAYYTYPKGKASTIKASIYKKLIYHNLYPGIDVEYSFPDDKDNAIEYALIVHPGADYSVAKLRYYGAEKLTMLAGEQPGKDSMVVSIPGTSDFIEDHSPTSYIKETGAKIASSFSVSTMEETFHVDNYDKTKTLVIDPLWNTSPGFTTNNAYDLDFDNKGNVYAYGSYGPFQVVKMNSSGVVQWTYNTVNIGTTYYGDFAVDKGSGTSYIVSGWTGSVDPILKVSTNGTLILTDYHDSVSDEMWRAVWDPCDHEVAIGGGGGSAFQAFVLDTNANTSLKSYNPIGAVLCCHDAELVTIDQYSKSFFMALCRSNVDPTLAPNALLKMPIPAYTPALFNVNDGYTFQELAGLYGASGVYNGMNGLAASPNWLYSYDGAMLKRWNKTTGALSSSLVVNATSFQWGGLDVDWCDNIYVGSQSSLKLYNSSLTLTSTTVLPNTVYDVLLNNACDTLFVCGKGYVSAYAVTPPAAPTITKSKSAPSCICTNTATATLMLCGNPDTNVTYLWSDGQTKQTATGLCPGTYTVTISFSCSETFSDTVTISGGGGGLTLSKSSTPSSCSSNTGTATVTVVGGTSPYTYLWSDGQTSSTATALSAGTYCVTVNDKNGCSDSICVSVGDIAGMTLSMVNDTNVKCKGGNNGSVGVNVAGGTSPYTFVWSNGQTSSDATSLIAGSYTVTVTDSSGCTATASATITEPPALTATISATVNVSCNGGSNGSSDVTGGGGTTPYTYNWSNGETTSSATSLSAGTYTLTLLDSNGCSVTATTIVTEPPVLSNSMSFTAASCGGSNGTATANPSGGTGLYTYLWSPTAQTNATATSLSAGTYTVTITDANGCSKKDSVTVTASGTLSASITGSNNVTCNGGSDGSITVTPTGGTSPYTYLWTPSAQTNATATSLTAGTYTVTVNDVGGCIVTVNFTITEPIAVTATTSGTQTVCLGQSANISVTGGGGTGPYTYAWSSGATTSGINTGPIVTNTVFTVTVTDSKGCASAPATDTVKPGPALKVTASPSVSVCPGTPVTITATGSGGDGIYTYSWSPGGANGTSTTVTPASTTTYTITLTDDCGTPAAKDSITITLYPSPVISFSADSISGCAPLCTTFNDLTTVSSGNITQWLWNLGDGSNDTNQDPSHCYPNPGTYNITLTVTTSDGCQSNLTTKNMITVYSHPHADFSISPQPVTIIDPSINFTDLSTDAYGINSWYWEFGDVFDGTSTAQNPSYAYPDTGIYCATLTVTNLHGCTDSITHCLVVYDQYTLYIPDAFSPNGDGLNDIFLPKGEGIKKYELYIFDRWGMKIYHTTDITKGWDGVVGGGSGPVSQEDTYVYMIKVTDNLNDQHTYIGKLTLIR